MLSHLLRYLKVPMAHRNTMIAPMLPYFLKVMYTLFPCSPNTERIRSHINTLDSTPSNKISKNFLDMFNFVIPTLCVLNSGPHECYHARTTAYNIIKLFKLRNRGKCRNISLEQFLWVHGAGIKLTRTQIRDCRGVVYTCSRYTHRIGPVGS